MRLVKLCLFGLLLFILINLSACGSGIGRRRQNGANIIRRPEPVTEVLTVMGHEFHYNWFRLAESRMAESWRETRRGEFVLELTLYSHANADEYFSRLMTLLTAGYGYDMFMMPPGISSVHIPGVHSLAQSGYLTDIFPLIDQCRHRNLDDYFINAFNTYTINERLYGFPLTFSFEYLAINAKLPEQFIDKFTLYDYVSTEQLMHLYIELINNYPDEFGFLSITNSLTFLNLHTLVHHNLNNYIDLENKRSGLTDKSFILFLENIRQLALRLWDPMGFTPGFEVLSQEEIRTRTEEFMFLTVGFNRTGINMLFPPEDSYFIHFIPLSNKNGELMPHSNFIFCFSETGNSTLAWEFMQYMLNTFIDFHSNTNVPFFNGFDTPIARNLFNANFEMWMTERLGRFGNFYGEIRYRINENDSHNALERLYMYSQMPIARFSHVPVHIVIESIFLMKQGTETAEEAAQRLHNLVTLWLTE